MSTLVSVIVPLYNYQLYIGDCIKSILKQNYRNFELIVVDDCSTDASFAIASQFRFRNSKLKVLRLPVNSGYSVAKNYGIMESQGDLITCLDADDMMTPNSISTRVKFLLENDLDFVHAQAININSKMTYKKCLKLQPPFHRDKPKVHAQTVLLKRFVHQKFGLYDENLRSRSDKEMWVRLFGKNCAGDHLVRKGFLKKDVAFYRKHKASMMSYRRKHRAYQDAVGRALNHAIRMRATEGITEENTKFLET